MESFIATMSPLTGPEIVFCSSSGNSVEWLVKFCLTDQGAPQWSQMDCSFDVKCVKVEQVKLVACFFVLRETADTPMKQHLVPQFCAGIVVDTSEKSVTDARVMVTVPLIKDRLAVIAKRLLKMLRNCSDDMTSIPDEVHEFLKVEVMALQSDSQLWQRAFISRLEFENCALSFLLSNHDLSGIVPLVSIALSQKCVVVRSSSSDLARNFASLIMLLLPDDKLILSSLNPSASLNEIAPGLCVQCTTLPLNDELNHRLLLSAFPTAILDLDEGHHMFPPSISEFPIEYLQLQVQRDEALLGGTLSKTVSHRSVSSSSKVVEEMIASLLRCQDHSLCLARWRQRMKFLSLRCVTCELAGDSSLVPAIEFIDNDIFLNFANFSSGRATIKRKVIEAGAKFDDF